MLQTYSLYPHPLTLLPGFTGVLNRLDVVLPQNLKRRFWAGTAMQKMPGEPFFPVKGITMSSFLTGNHLDPLHRNESIGKIILESMFLLFVKLATTQNHQPKKNHLRTFGWFFEELPVKKKPLVPSKNNTARWMSLGTLAALEDEFPFGARPIFRGKMAVSFGEGKWLPCPPCHCEVSESVSLSFYAEVSRFHGKWVR